MTGTYTKAGILSRNLEPGDEANRTLNACNVANRLNHIVNKETRCVYERHLPFTRCLAQIFELGEKINVFHHRCTSAGDRQYPTTPVKLIHARDQHCQRMGK